MAGEFDTSLLDKSNKQKQLNNRFPLPIPFHFAYFCHTFPVNKYPRNSSAQTKQFGVLDDKSLIRHFVV